MERKIAKVLITEEQLKKRVAELGEQITNEYFGKDLLTIGIFKGAVPFFADLIRQIRIPLRYDFMAVSSYGSSNRSSGAVRLLKDLETSVEDKHVLIVEDIVDTGLTLKYLKENLLRRQPLSLKIVTLLDKPERRQVDIQPDYNGFVIPNEFAVGYGLDYDEMYRNLTYIGVLKPEVYEK
ncbi:MAG: hypoxanthine phosphoribosyltransferase [Dehalobacter sp. 4CP]|jgi:hypoxanthine phosphoribosyltransferase|uniref:Hypoxanthine phosphoribosyltransferase n=1 Tax=Dehalobacter restrictus (strain DSM 9455 / PER-K23) TaxID=871738 RepID=A0ABN4BXG6_DEHRP|nr:MULTISPECIES: hypoxanthine phosphoribosyltransferase [Dehalobacter]NBJ15311.1 hypoxanthine phosphoribosyltransferase [Dehalobacter sp. 4CP]AFV02624.1 Hypoxanthine-guanine phosphoribosyltransferase [Dehalobacter sp. DCA]AFV05611.1 Hypoxanthine-guanine phosphoribosyltransferase [Dehalobacter sp. CF]AHF10662.1 hypoxanthine phosphoribosyltransferase [Dehalobacter restrictus DSM 9455]EQB21716.1 Hypoxanthine-guanine phosphoribosyltransferase [Dehalobacter sp. UNSWDHB]